MTPDAAGTPLGLGVARGSIGQFAMVQTLVMILATLTSLVLLAVLVVQVTDRPTPPAEGVPDQETTAANGAGPRDPADAERPGASGRIAPGAADEAPEPTTRDGEASDQRGGRGIETPAEALEVGEPPAGVPASPERLIEEGSAVRPEAFGPLAPLVGGVWETGERGTPSWSRSVFRPLLGGAFVEHRLWSVPEPGAPEVLVSQTVYRWDRRDERLTAEGYARNGTTSSRVLEVGPPLAPEDITDGPRHPDGAGGTGGLSVEAVALIGYATEETSDDLFEYRQEIVIDPATPDRYIWRVFTSPLGELDWRPTASFVFRRIEAGEG